MIDSLSEAGSWERAIRDGRIPVTDYAPTPLHNPADQRGEGGKVRGGGISHSCSNHTSQVQDHA